MSYQYTKNQGEIPIYGMRLLGLSNKDENQIGQFGTGLKESIALLVRKDIEIIIFSGLCKIEFSSQPIGGQDEICFRLSESRDGFASNKWHGMGMHVNFGQYDWDDCWMALREIICNAKDEGDFSHDITSNEPFGVAGETCVFIELKPEVLTAYSEVTNRLSFLDEPKILHEDDDIKIYEKRKKNEMQIYHKGVWIHESTTRSVFDYEIKTGLKLTESRSCDEDQIRTCIAKELKYFPVDLACEILKNKQEFLFEKKAMSLAAYCYIFKTSGNNWREAFKKTFGKKAVLCKDNNEIHNKLIENGKIPIELDITVHDFLERAGCPEGIESLTEEQQRYEHITEPSAELQSCFDGVWDFMKSNGMTGESIKPLLIMFKQSNTVKGVLNGTYKNGTCGINEECVGSVECVNTCIEEIAHHVTGASDETREFQNYFIRSIGNLINKQSKETK